MSDEAEIEAGLWKALKSDRTAMLGLASGGATHAQPMTMLMGEREGRGPLWSFTSNESDLSRELGGGGRAMLHFASHGHELFASMDGRLAPETDPAVIDRLWNKWVAAWFEGGRDDPKLQLLRFDPEAATIWLNDHSLLAGVKLMLGSDPKEDYRDKVAEVELGSA